MNTKKIILLAVCAVPCLWQGTLLCLSETPWIDPIASTEAIAQALENKGKVATIDGRDSAGFTGLMLAAQKEDPTRVEMLIKHGANINLQSNADYSKQTALHLALQNADYAPQKSPKVVRLLLDKKADLMIRDAGGIPAVHCLMNIRSYPLRKEIMTLILSSAKDDAAKKQLINAQDKRGNTMMHMMVQNRDRDGLQQFLNMNKKLIDPKIKNNKKQTVADTAMQMNVPEITGIICKSGLWQCGTMIQTPLDF